MADSKDNEENKIIGFNNVVRQDMAVRLLKNALKAHKISHAYMITGEIGVDKLDMAEAFAKSLLCESDTGEACNNCRACHQADNHNHPDIIYVTPEKEGLISVDDIRDKVNSAISIKPYQGKYKVYIIAHAEWMNEGAQNALLKTMEEPPEYVVIIFLTDNEEHFLPTIMSRVVTIPLVPIAYEEKIKTDDFLKVKKAVLPYLTADKDTELNSVEPVIAEIAKDKLLSLKALEVALLFYRDVLIFKSTDDESLVLLSEEIYDIRKKADGINYEGINNIIKEIETSRRRIEMSVKAEYVFDDLFMTVKENCK